MPLKHSHTNPVESTKDLGGGDSHLIPKADTESLGRGEEPAKEAVGGLTLLNEFCIIKMK